MDFSKATESMTVEVPAFVWLAVHGYCCLALRHPDSKGDVRDYVQRFTHMIGTRLVQQGLLTQRELDFAQRVEQEQGGYSGGCPLCGPTPDPCEHIPTLKDVLS